MIKKLSENWKYKWCLIKHMKSDSTVSIHLFWSPHNFDVNFKNSLINFISTKCQSANQNKTIFLIFEFKCFNTALNLNSIFVLELSYINWFVLLRPFSRPSNTNQCMYESSRTKLLVKFRAIVLIILQV